MPDDIKSKLLGNLGNKSKNKTTGTGKTNFRFPRDPKTRQFVKDYSKKFEGEYLARVKVFEETPLGFLVRSMNNPFLDITERIACAAKAAPYIHQKRALAKDVEDESEATKLINAEASRSKLLTLLNSTENSAKVVNVVDTQTAVEVNIEDEATPSSKKREKEATLSSPRKEKDMFPISESLREKLLAKWGKK